RGLSARAAAMAFPLAAIRADFRNPSRSPAQHAVRHEPTGRKTSSFLSRSSSTSARPVWMGSEALWILSLAHILFGKPVATFPGYSLVPGVPGLQRQDIGLLAVI